MKRLIPVKIEKMDIPDILTHVTRCDFTKSDMEDWNWKRLRDTIFGTREQGQNWTDIPNSPTSPTVCVKKDKKSKNGLSLNFLKIFKKKKSSSSKSNTDS